MTVRPTITRMVHYVSHGSPVRADGTQAYSPVCRAAVITEVADLGPGESAVGLCVLNPTGIFFRTIAEGGCAHHDGAGVPGDPDCAAKVTHGAPFRYCGQPGCGWTEDAHHAGTWHWWEECRDAQR